ncbi:hypothetical protein ACFX15_034022 [Malus domestica]|uniref:Major facilitator superfamily (MFS) profile domain-containing protein n=1 Tax=Malus domestica TaxID=3750 RepID=A0A498K1K9_MALDO|nr:hypothetical protein DVH24_021606 [Malus domestica]
MAGGGIGPTKGGKEYPGKLTARVLLTCMVAATGGLIFGYDLGVSGGVTSMDSFLKKFFPEVYIKESTIKPSDDQYCKFDSQKLTLFTSSLYLAARVVSLCINCAQYLWMLVVGRILLGFGIGCANQSVPIYVSEVAPYKYRGALNMMFQLSITIGILAAGVINYFFAEIKGGWGWRLSLGGAAVPAIMIMIGALVLPETPNSLVERGKNEEAKSQLLKIRGVANVDEEFDDLVAASDASKLVKHPWETLLTKKYRPQLVFALAIPAFQQLTGMNVITFYAPVLFKTMGFGSSASLMSTVITNAVNAVATLVSIFTVDKVGRRTLFIEGGAQMFLTQVIIGIAIAVKFGVSGNPGELSKGFVDGLLACICVYVAGFAWSWGPLGWLVPSEIFPLEVRSAAQSINVATNMIFTFVIAQVFTTMLCHLKFGLFFFFAFWVLIMNILIYKYLPETKGVPIEDMHTIWQKHPFWKKYVLQDKGIAMGKEGHDDV